MTTLNKAIEICRGMEAASHNMNALKNEEVNKIKDISQKKSGQHKHWHRIKKPLQSIDQKALQKKCLFCYQIKAKCVQPGKKAVWPVVREITSKPQTSVNFKA